MAEDGLRDKMLSLLIEGMTAAGVAAGLREDSKQLLTGDGYLLAALK